MQSASSQAEASVSHSSKNFILKACIFATGLAGIVAEYVMSTLASYLLGNAVVQWTLTISLMLFAMGLGSRMSKSIQNNLLDAFIIVELVLSLVCAVSALATYTLSIYIATIDAVIYTIAVSIGLLIGLEIPIATRLNALFEELRVNISSVMEHDYYGALIGGLLFAFIALPYLGLTYTPIILGSINLVVAAALFFQQRKHVKFKRMLSAAFVVLPIFLIALSWFAKPIVRYSEQYKYRDTVVYTEQTKYQRIVMTKWKEHFWLYLDGNLQFSTYDEARYHEPLVHPAMHLAQSHERILVLGGGDGMAARELLKYNDVGEIDLVDIDPAITRLGREDGRFLAANNGALLAEKVTIHNQDAALFVRETNHLYDVIFIDLPDPKTVSLARLYSRQFYHQLHQLLTKNGVIVTQATSPFFSRKAFLSIYKTMQAAGFSVLPMHNNIPTMGEWGWMLGVKKELMPEQQLKTNLLKHDFSSIETRFINHDAMVGMVHFGKAAFIGLDKIEVNDEFDLVISRYYDQGEWDYY